MSEAREVGAVIIFVVLVALIIGNGIYMAYTLGRK